MINRDGIVHIGGLTHNAAPLGVFDGGLDESSNSGESEPAADERVNGDLICGIQYCGGAILRHKGLAR
jgi:hypothetical protein